MGGYGSGRRQSYDRRRQVECSWVLDADTIPRPIRAGNEGALDLTIRAMSQRIQVTYLIRDDGAGFELDVWLPSDAGWILSRTRLDQVPTSFGGVRTYLRCPACEHGVVKLYSPQVGHGGFACRRCHQLAYRSSQERRVSAAALIRHTKRLHSRLRSPEALQGR